MNVTPSCHTLILTLDKKDLVYLTFESIILHHYLKHSY